MPMITLRLAHPQPEALAAEAAALASSLTARFLAKDPRLTAVAVEIVPRERWFVGGQSLAALGQASFFLEVRVTEGTNTKDQKEAYVSETFAAFGRLLGEVTTESYVYVIDAGAEAYGYGGRTQERRYVEGHP